MLESEQRKKIERELHETIEKARKLQEILQRDEEQQQEEQYAEVPAEVEVAISAMRTIYRSMRMEHWTKSDESVGDLEESTIKTEQTIKCRELSFKEEQLRDVCCDALIEYLVKIGRHAPGLSRGEG